MSGFENMIEKACLDKDIPGAILAAGDNTGSFHYAKAFGYRSLKELSNLQPMEIDGVMWLASCTKLLVTIAAMQCVERGQLSLDEDVSDVLPEIKGLQILTGFEGDSDTPILVDNHKPITLRHLLTHSSGLSYDVFNPLLSRYRSVTGQDTSKPLGGNGRVKDRCLAPLLFSPGDSWEYGVGLDWAGQMVERVNGNISLEEYLQRNILAPLGAKHITFHPTQYPEIMSKMVDMSMRDGGITKFGTTANPGGKAVYSSKVLWDPDTEDCYGGSGEFGNPCEYFKVLQSICANDGRLLKPETVEEMFRPQLSEAAAKALTDKLSIPEVAQCLGSFPQGMRANYGIGGIMNLDDFGSRSKGSISWGGYPNLKWWIDRDAGVCGIWGSQLFPPGDPKINDLFQTFQEEIYRRISASKEKL